MLTWPIKKPYKLVIVKWLFLSQHKEFSILTDFNYRFRWSDFVKMVVFVQEYIKPVISWQDKIQVSIPTSNLKNSIFTHIICNFCLLFVEKISFTFPHIAASFEQWILIYYKLCIYVLFTIPNICLDKLTFFCSAVPPQQCEKSNYINFDTYDTIKFLIAMQTQYYDLYIFICTCIAPIPKGGIHYKSLG